MLQEHPTQIQPRSSSTRGETQDDLQQDLNSNTNNHREVDADVSRILIDLANQVTSPKANEASVLKRRVSSKGDVKASLPIKTDTNLHLHQERSQPDPIMLLAAAAAVIDDEGKYKGRSYERREIRLYGRHGTTKRKSFTYGSNDDSDGRSSSSMLHRRYSERRHRYSRPSVSGHGGVFSSDTWNTPSSNHHIKEDEEMRETHESQSEGTHAFSWQYLSMKQNPRIKRNAMHAYITYMIYTDMAHEQQRVVGSSFSCVYVYIGRVTHCVRKKKNRDLIATIHPQRMFITLSSNSSSKHPQDIITRKTLLLQTMED
ncbi:hypothetical protein PS15m_006040 [Mucor circinelloides]